MSSPSLAPGRSALLIALAAACGVCLGFAVWLAVAGSMEEVDRELWVLTPPPIPIVTGALVGELPPAPLALDLDAYEGIAPAHLPFQHGRIELKARVPTDGQLHIHLGTMANRAAPMPPNTMAGLPAEPPPDGEFVPPHAYRPARPAPAGVVLLIDRTRRDQITSTELNCTAARAPSTERFEITLEATADGLAVELDGQPHTRCTGSWPRGDVVISSGIRRIQLEHLSITDPGGETLSEDFTTPLRSWLGALMACLAGGLLGGWGLVRWRLVPASLPLLAVPLLAMLDLQPWLDSLRLLALPTTQAPLLAAGSLAVALWLLRAARGTPASAAATAAAVPVTVAVAALLAGWPPDALGWVLLGGCALPWVALGWVNTHPLRFRGPISWGLCLVLLLVAELGVRATALDDSWHRTAGWERARIEFEELLVLQQHRSYPSEGFPIQPPEPRPDLRRMVALGSSSTGGAYQMDDLDLFWPKQLEEGLQGWQVVNQGVGGWNSLHVRLYTESQIERLGAEIYLIYLGHNDVLSTAPIPYAKLLERYQPLHPRAQTLKLALERSRLFVGFEFAVLALRDRKAAVAVPVEDARDNLAAIVQAAQAQGARVALITEALNPDPLPVRPYGAMLEELADQTGSLYIDAATVLWERSDPDLFLDDCHLSVRGHQALAALIHERLDQTGWLEPGAP